MAQAATADRVAQPADLRSAPVGADALSLRLRGDWTLHSGVPDLDGTREGDRSQGNSPSGHLRRHGAGGLGQRPAHLHPRPRRLRQQQEARNRSHRPAVRRPRVDGVGDGGAQTGRRRREAHQTLAAGGLRRPDDLLRRRHRPTDGVHRRSREKLRPADHRQGALPSLRPVAVHRGGRRRCAAHRLAVEPAAGADDGLPRGGATADVRRADLRRQPDRHVDGRRGGRGDDRHHHGRANRRRLRRLDRHDAGEPGSRRAARRWASSRWTSSSCRGCWRSS